MSLALGKQLHHLQEEDTKLTVTKDLRFSQIKLTITLVLSIKTSTIVQKFLFLPFGGEDGSQTRTIYIPFLLRITSIKYIYYLNHN